MDTDCPRQLTFWKLGKQQVTATPNGGQVVSDAGLLLLRNFDQQLGFLHDLAGRRSAIRRAGRAPGAEFDARPARDPVGHCPDGLKPS